MRSFKRLFVLGPARSGTTLVTTQLNRSDRVLLFHGLNSYQLRSGLREAPRSGNPGFAMEFNHRRKMEGDSQRKGSLIPNPEDVRSPDELYAFLGESYPVVGEELILAGPPREDRHWVEVLYGHQLRHHFVDYHLFVLERPTEVIEALISQFPDQSVWEHYVSVVHRFARLLDLFWLLQRSRMMFCERLGESAFSSVHGWLGIDWRPSQPIPFFPSRSTDSGSRHNELTARLPGLETLDHFYESLLERTDEFNLLSGEEDGDCRSGELKRSVSGGLKVLLRRCREDLARPDRNSAGLGKPVPLDSIRVVLRTDHALAADSVDHLHPLGTKQDNSHSEAFAEKLLGLYAGNRISLLDLGCAGGAFVRAVNDAGHLGIGLEGSDYSRIHRRAEWATIPDRLFTCDCAKPFEILIEENGLQRPGVFEVITAWELLEHISEKELSRLLLNVREHLHGDEGLFIASIHLRPCMEDGVEYHQTVRPEWWWRYLFRDHGFHLVDRALDYFDEDWVRGPRPDQNAMGSCHVVLSLSPDNAIVRRLDRVAIQGFDHAHLKSVEMKQLILAARERETSLNLQLESLRGAFAHIKNRASNLESELGMLRAAREWDRRIREGLERGASGFSVPVLRCLAAHASERCRILGVRRVAFFGAGRHTRILLPIWREMAGPEVAVVLDSSGSGGSICGIPVWIAGTPLPAEVDALVPSSHMFEEDLRKISRELYPGLRWIFLWNPRGREGATLEEQAPSIPNEPID